MNVYQKSYCVPVADINAMQHVDNQIYLRWMMDVAFGHMDALAWPIERFRDIGEGFVVKSHFIEYLAPAFEADQLVKFTWISELSERRATRSYSFYKLPDFTPLLRAETKWVYVNAETGRPCTMPDQVFSAIKVASEADITDSLEITKRELSNSNP